MKASGGGDGTSEDDKNVLHELALTNKVPAVQAAARRRLEAMRLEATTADKDEAALAKLAAEDPDEAIRAAATGKLTDQNLLAKGATADSSENVRATAVSKLKDQALLSRIAATDASMARPGGRHLQVAGSSTPRPDCGYRCQYCRPSGSI